MSLKIEGESTIRCEHKFRAMGGEFQLLCFPQTHLSKHDVISIFKKAEEEVHRIQAKLTDFCDSPFNRVNDFAGIKPVKVDNEIFNLVKRSLQISKASKGVFDISFASVGHIWRKAKNDGRTLSFLERTQAQAHIDYRKIKLNHLTKTIYLPHEQMRIGLGGIGKGYAVDYVYEFLKKEGIINFYVNGSGDIRVHSHNSAPRPWRIGIRNPLSKDSSKSIGVIQLSKGSVASSGGYIHFNEHEKNQADHHIINPKNGCSNDEIIATTVIADDAITSDTTATILMNLCVKDALLYLNKHKFIGFIIDKYGQSHLSQKALKSFGL
ncbi:FAD:protein FMN transferase [Halobacteriovorax sp.]|uniref:FAD:protein FMN transferase n=1 Tax=Halobacteriovorax sp. TaxID=2020862 RepID=UPI003AF2A627